MSPPANEFETFLAEDESLVHGVSGALVDDEHRTEGMIGVTDRRVLFHSGGDRFVDVSHDAISSIGSRTRTRYTHRGLAYRLLVAVGAALALAAIAGAGALGPGALGFVLASLAVGGAVGAEHVRRRGLEGAVSVGEDGSPLVFGLGYVSLLSLVALVAVTGRLLAIPFSLIALGGFALADHGLRRKRALDTLGGSRRHEREVNIHLVDGRRLSLRVDDDDRFDRELSETVREVPREQAREQTRPEPASH